MTAFEAFSRYPQVDRAILYGSRAKGNFKRGSDIDLTLVGGDDLMLKVMFRILDNLDDLLLPYSIDLSILDHIDDADVLDHIRRAGVTFYEKRKLTEIHSPAPFARYPSINSNG